MKELQHNGFSLKIWVGVEFYYSISKFMNIKCRGWLVKMEYEMKYYNHYKRTLW